MYAVKIGSFAVLPAETRPEPAKTAVIFFSNCFVFNQLPSRGWSKKYTRVPKARGYLI